MVLARLLGPKDFGLVGMVTAFTGVLDLFRDFGLSSAAVQRTTVTEDQISTLFWINISVGALLGLLAVAMAPVIAAFYHEPRLFGVTVVLAAGFLFNACRSTTLSASPAPNAIYRSGSDRRSLLDCGYCNCDRGGQGWLRVLVPCSDDAHTSNRKHDWSLADHEMDARVASQACWDSLDDAFWRHPHSEWSRSLCCL